MLVSGGPDHETQNSPLRRAHSQEAEAGRPRRRRRRRHELDYGTEDAHREATGTCARATRQAPACHAPPVPPVPRPRERRAGPALCSPADPSGLCDRRPLRQHVRRSSRLGLPSLRWRRHARAVPDPNGWHSARPRQRAGLAHAQRPRRDGRRSPGNGAPADSTSLHIHLSARTIDGCPDRGPTPRTRPNGRT
jgi:hypothetical protein